MIPRVSQGLADLAIKLVMSIGPETRSRFAAASTGMIAMLLGALSQESERAVAVRMADIEDMQALLGDDHGVLPAAARDGFLTGAPASLTLSDVDAFHGRGMALVIELHAWAEEHDPTLDRRIWDFLRRHTERHRLDLPNLA